MVVVLLVVRRKAGWERPLASPAEHDRCRAGMRAGGEGGRGAEPWLPMRSPDPQTLTPSRGLVSAWWGRPTPSAASDGGESALPHSVRALQWSPTSPSTPISAVNDRRWRGPSSMSCICCDCGWTGEVAEEERRPPVDTVALEKTSGSRSMAPLQR